MWIASYKSKCVKTSSNESLATDRQKRKSFAIIIAEFPDQSCKVRVLLNSLSRLNLDSEHDITKRPEVRLHINI